MAVKAGVAPARFRGAQRRTATAVRIIHVTSFPDLAAEHINPAGVSGSRSLTLHYAYARQADNQIQANDSWPEIQEVQSGFRTRSCPTRRQM